MAQHNETVAEIRRIAEFVATRPTMTRSEVKTGLRLEGSVSTVYRLMDAAVSQGLLRTNGSKKSTSYSASDALRAEIVSKMVRGDSTKRSKIGYHSEWLDSYVPNQTTYLRPDTLDRLMKRCPPGTAPLASLNDHEVSMFMCDLSYASSRLEGNAYDYAGTLKLLEHHIETSNCSDREKVEILNHRDAVRYLINGIREDPDNFKLTPYTVRSLHSLLSSDLLKDRNMCGNLRTSSVQVKFSSYMPLYIPSQISSGFDKVITTANQIENPFEQSFFLLVHLPYLQPFEDCNKRTARVVCNLPLMRAGITPISWMDALTMQYKDAVLAIYEHNEPLLMDEIFADCFVRSAEKFSLMQRQQNPDPIAARYRQEIRETVRARVLDDEERISPNVQADAAEFLNYIDLELQALGHNEMIGVRYGLSPGAIAEWLKRSDDADSADSETSAAGYERARG